MFSHGQLYVALSRATRWEDITVQLPDGYGDTFVKNVVYEEILSSNKDSNVITRKDGEDEEDEGDEEEDKEMEIEYEEDENIREITSELNEYDMM